MDFLRINSLLDPVLQHLQNAVISAKEEEVLKERFWDVGEDIRLREDWRFRQTAWGRWTTAASYLVNDEVYQTLREQAPEQLNLTELLKDIQKDIGHHCVFCPADPRMVLQNYLVSLAASELSDDPLIENEPGPLARFTTHLPVHTLRAVAASEPIGEWGPRAQEQAIETLGWVKVEGRTLNERMFVARIEGHSMEGDKKGIEAGKYAIFELWPAGDRKEKILLLRGSFKDPETGVYAIKQYFPEPRNENNERRQVRLVSKNTDKSRYPDIFVTVDQEDDIKVVAEFLSMLDNYDYARQPRRVTRKGCRDLDNHAAISNSLNKSIGNFFADVADQTEDHEESAETPEEPFISAPQLVCLDWLSGGLHLKLPALSFLPSFVKKIELVAGTGRQTLLASNLKARENRLPVQPEPEGYHLEAPDFDEVKEELDQLSFKPMPIAEPLLFAVDADNTGRLMKSRELACGRECRLLLPPGQQNLPADTCFYKNGWAHLEFICLPDAMPPDLVELLASLDLNIGSANIFATWCDEIPIAWLKNAAGESYPRFSTRQNPVLRIGGCQTTDSGEMSAYLSGEGIDEQLYRPAGSEWRIRIENLPAGRYGLKILHRRTRFAPVQVFFAIDDALPELPDCQIKLLCEDQTTALAELNQSNQPDLADWLTGTSTPELLLQGPPCWPLAIHWSEDRTRHSVYESFDCNGCYDLGAHIRIIEHYLLHTPVGELIIDAGELGRNRISFRRWQNPATRIVALKKAIAENSPMLSAISADPGQLFHFYIAPLLNILGIRSSQVDNREIDGIKVASTHALHTLRTQKDRISRNDHALLLLLPELSQQDARSSMVENRLAEVGSECSVEKVFLTDGANWRLFNCNSQLLGEMYDLRQVFADNTDNRQKLFLNDFTGA